MASSANNLGGAAASTTPSFRDIGGGGGGNNRASSPSRSDDYEDDMLQRAILLSLSANAEDRPETQDEIDFLRQVQNAAEIGARLGAAGAAGAAAAGDIPTSNEELDEEVENDPLLREIRERRMALYTYVNRVIEDADALEAKMQELIR